MIPRRSIEQLREDLSDYKEYVGQHHARMNQRIATLEEDNDRLTERVAELEAQLDPDPNGKEYESMSRDERVHKIRTTLFEDAQHRHSGKSQMTYKEILRLFDNHPSDGYAYKLLTLAGAEEGFEYADSNGTGKVVRVDTGAVNDETLVHAGNNRTSQEAA
ncbi:hypothetical protein HAPAU_36650 [Halalkalicoccus paucihalophilus]|uniref:Uncharacterized protein n=1 Tax=Halalkalicoccus paucihalophilus TaxID=1008153 RepID=A0A151A9C3_9EURY|nr:hypothetical protein [Halalkalicoccus paucihalophilus]KYH24194.1 hypothetical protein HAPAU_36650 [Halalkalicoccus paucihalophilus]